MQTNLKHVAYDARWRAEERIEDRDSPSAVRRPSSPPGIVTISCAFRDLYRCHTSAYSFSFFPRPEAGLYLEPAPFGTLFNVQAHVGTSMYYAFMKINSWLRRVLKNERYLLLCVGTCQSSPVLPELKSPGIKSTSWPLAENGSR